MRVTAGVWPRTGSLGPVVALLLLLSACATPEQEVREVLEQGEVAAEERNLTRLGRLVAEDYADEEGRDREALLGLVGVYLRHGGSLHVLKRVETLEVEGRSRARVTLLVAVASVALEDFRDLRSVSADLLRVDLVLERRDPGWQVVRATWRPARLAEFF